MTQRSRPAALRYTHSLPCRGGNRAAARRYPLVMAAVLLPALPLARPPVTLRDDGWMARRVSEIGADRPSRTAVPAATPPLSRDAADRADLAAVVDGDRQALARLYERHREPLFGFILRTTGYDRGLAEEVLQDTLLAVWFNAASFIGAAQVRTWIYSIARRNALSKLRKKRPDPVDPEDALPVVDTGPTPDDQALARLEAGQLDQLIDRLPEVFRTVLVLAFVEDLPYPEISQVLDVPIGTIKSRVSRARAALVALARQERVLG